MTSPYGQKMIHRGAITDTSTVAGYLGATGDYRVEGGKLYQLCLSGTTIASVGVNTWLQLDSVAGSTGYTVEELAATTCPVYAVNNSGAAIATATYFWALRRGIYACDSLHVNTTTVAANSLVVLNSDSVVVALATTVSTHVPLYRIGHTCAALATTGGPIYFVGYGG